MQLIDPGELLGAFDHHALFFAYQPVIELPTGRVPYVEALVRWAHPTLGLIQPAAFLPLIQQAGLSERLTAFGLAEVLGALPDLRSIYGPDVGVAINLSGSQLKDPSATTALIERELSTHAEPADCLLIELVEDLALHKVQRSAPALDRLRSIGVRVILDDFGTGASSLATLTDLNYDGLKIDRRFTKGLLSNATARSVVEAVVAFANKTDITLVAEGIETSLQMHALAELGCDLGQGYLLGRPEPLADLPRDVGYVSTLERPPVRATSTHGVDEILAAALAISPRSTNQPFTLIMEQLEALDDQAAAFGPAGIDARLEIGRRLTLAAIYGGESTLALKWSLHTSRLAERVDRWACVAEVLGMIASCPDDQSEDGAVRIESLARAMEIRISKPMTIEESGGVDNAIGAAFANLGLFDHARNWWTESVTRHNGHYSPGSAMVCANLAELELQWLEGDTWAAASTSREMRQARVDSLITGLEANPHTVPSIVAALQSRLALTRNDVDEAARALPPNVPIPDDLLGRFLTLAARARLALAQQNPVEAVSFTTALVDTLEGHLLLQQHDRGGLRLHGQALLAAGRSDEGLAVLQTAFERQAISDARKLKTLFEWIRLHVDLNVRMAALLGPSGTPIVMPSRTASP